MTSATSPLRVAVLTSALPGWELESMFAELERAEVQGVEVLYPADRDGSSRSVSLEQIRRLASAHGLEICGLAAPVGCPIGTPEVVAALRAAARLGGASVRVFAPPFQVGEPADEQLGRLARAIDTALAKAGPGARMLIELSQDTLIPSPELAWRVLAPFGERVGVVYDPANMIVEGNLPPEYSVSLLRGLLHHVHVKNSVLRSQPGELRYDFVPLERGAVDWRRVVRSLLNEGYRGWLSIDRLSGPATRQRLRRDVAALRGLLAGVDVVSLPPNDL